MPSDGAITFSDLQGSLDLLRIDCDGCNRHRCYAVANLIDEYGGDAKFFDWLTRNCSKKISSKNSYCSIPWRNRGCCGAISMRGPTGPALSMKSTSSH